MHRRDATRQQEDLCSHRHPPGTRGGCTGVCVLCACVCACYVHVSVVDLCMCLSLICARICVSVGDLCMCAVDLCVWSACRTVCVCATLQCCACVQCCARTACACPCCPHWHGRGLCKAATSSGPFAYMQCSSTADHDTPHQVGKLTSATDCSRRTTQTITATYGFRWWRCRTCTLHTRGTPPRST
jgi:hypothetical protein